MPQEISCDSRWVKQVWDNGVCTSALLPGRDIQRLGITIGCYRCFRQSNQIAWDCLRDKSYASRISSNGLGFQHCWYIIAHTRTHYNYENFSWGIDQSRSHPKWNQYSWGRTLPAERILWQNYQCLSARNHDVTSWGLYCQCLNRHGFVELSENSQRSREICSEWVMQRSESKNGTSLHQKRRIWKGGSMLE